MNGRLLTRLVCWLRRVLSHSRAGLACIAVLTFAQSTLCAPSARASMLFTDVTVEAGIDFVETIGDDAMTNIVESTGVGCAFLDYDGDGWLDIYLLSGHWLEGLSDPRTPPEERRSHVTDRLYRSLGDGRFEDVTQSAGVDQVGYGMAVVAADYDADGDTDLYVTNYGPNFLYRNNGDGSFSDVAAELGVNDPRFSGGACFLDYDRDGYLDLYVGAYLVYTPADDEWDGSDGFPGPLAYAGEQDKLFRGAPDGSFTDVTAVSGIEIDPVGRAMGVGAFDYDNDGFLDIFVSNDAMENFLLHNQGDGSFENRAIQTGVAFGEAGDARAAMASEIADIDGDGWLDLLVPDIQFSCLYRNVRGMMFRDDSSVSGLAAACGRSNSWGGIIADFDLDGLADLYICNGDIFRLDPDTNLLLKGDGRGGFVDVSKSAGEWSSSAFVSRGSAKGDFDNDGDVDLLVASLDDRPVLLRNDTPREGRHWLAVELVGQGGNRDAIGAVVQLSVGGRTQKLPRISGGSYMSQHDHRLYFGLGEHELAERVQIDWPDGSRQLLEGVAADQLLRVEQGGGDP